MKQIPSFVFRRWAMAAIKPVMSVLIVLALIAALPGLISSTVSMLTKADPSYYLDPVAEDMVEYLLGTDPVYRTDMQGTAPTANPEGSPAPDATQAPADGAATTRPAADDPQLRAARAEREEAIMARGDELTEEYYAAIRTFIEEKGLLFLGMLVLQMLLAPALAVVLTGALLDVMNKKEITLLGSLQRLRLAPKALAVNLWMLLRILAWMLPGIALALLGMAVLLLPMPEILAVLASMMLLVAGMGLMLVLGLRAMMHYYLASIAVVDVPTLSITGCVRASFHIMRRRKMELFMMEISFAPWMLLVSMLSMTCLVFFGGVIGMALSMMAELLLSVYMSAAETGFYLAYSGRMAAPSGDVPSMEGEQPKEPLN